MASVDERDLEHVLSVFPCERIARTQLKKNTQFSRYPMQKYLLRNRDKARAFVRLNDTRMPCPFGRLVFNTAREQRQIVTPLITASRVSSRAGDQPTDAVVVLRGKINEQCSLPHPPQLCSWFDSPLPPIESYLKWRATDKLEKQVREDMRSNASSNFPLSTVNIRWHVNVHVDNGAIEHKIRHILSSFGQLRSFRFTSPSSAVVVYENLSDSCRLVGRGERFKCEDIEITSTWFHSTMSMRRFYKRGQGMWVLYK